MASQCFSKKDRLYKSSRIKNLFLEGERLYESPFKVIWTEVEPLDSLLKVAISVPKKRLPKAIQRNQVKRLVREAFRKQKSSLIEQLQVKNKSIILMLIYTLPVILSFAEIEDKISVTLQRLADEV
ncbi:MAG: ribonuclease P protein component [Flavobacteriales bacterium]|nr:ribonuclease P protein component [Flavobacteriales bacterium]|tara:strand:- start:4859 stop:5236 length:378 start_codon:yes stop_codon:yes gene_type:complete